MVTYAFIVIASEQSERGNPQKKRKIATNAKAMKGLQAKLAMKILLVQNLTKRSFLENKRSVVSLENKRSEVSLENLWLL